jgi:capsular exopolysaccharide synthesis family protein
MDLDLRHMSRIARQRGWIIVLLLLVAGAAAYYDAASDTKMYRASATMMLTQPPSIGSESVQSGLSVEQLEETYQLMITSASMRERVAETLGFESIPTSISAFMVPESRSITVTTVDTDPERAALVANAVATEFQGYLDDQALQRAQVAKQGLDTQIKALRARLGEIDAEIMDLNTTENADDVMIQQRIVDLGQERTQINRMLVDLNTRSITIDTTMVGSSAQVDLANPAVTPSQPFAPMPSAAAKRGLMAGLLLGIAVVALLEYLDNTVKPERPLETLTGAPVLASVPLARMKAGSEQLFTMTQPNSPMAEAVRLLRTNLEFAAASGVLGSVTVTSPGSGEGKSTIAANLAVATAQAGVKTVLIDADMREPSQQWIFGVPNTGGLTTLLTHPDRDWREQASHVAVQNLLLVTTGPVPPNPSDLVSSARFEALLAQVKEDADLVVIDSPPVLAASDALSIAAHTDGVVLVCQSHATRIDALRHSVRAVRQGGIRLVGVVLNRQKGQQGSTYRGGYYGTIPPEADSHPSLRAPGEAVGTR